MNEEKHKKADELMAAIENLRDDLKILKHSATGKSIQLNDVYFFNESKVALLIIATAYKKTELEALEKEYSEL